MREGGKGQTESYVPKEPLQKEKARKVCCLVYDFPIDQSFFDPQRLSLSSTFDGISLDWDGQTSEEEEGF